jgi:hypothetical protein
MTVGLPVLEAEVQRAVLAGARDRLLPRAARGAARVRIDRLCGIRRPCAARLDVPIHARVGVLARPDRHRLPALWTQRHDLVVGVALRAAVRVQTHARLAEDLAAALALQ